MNRDRTERPPIAPRLLALRSFLQSESAAGLALIVAACMALAWSNSRYAPSYFALVATPVAVRVGSEVLAMPLDAWVNDGLMALFFLTVALEIRREMVEGELPFPRRVGAPALAALGGMIVPGLIYAFLTREDPALLRGWAVPVATDIAFALAALSVLGRRVPVRLKMFLTVLAIFDDLGAIVVIALFYANTLNPPALVAACLVLVALYGVNRAGVQALTPYILGGILLWAFVLRSGIHPTLAGVALAFVVPIKGEESAARRLQDGLQGLVTWVSLPMFGLANSGLKLSGVTWTAMLSPAVIGICAALFIGKQIGVFGTIFAAVRAGWVRMPSGLSWSQLYGAAILCGIGFTMSLFIADLSFRGMSVHSDAKLAIFLGSLLSAVVGIAVLAAVTGGRQKARSRR